ncbi:MAG: hypothetical protein K5656_09940 [Lachnospiraceae bacterium]|nr:hypothetical protein [Lachnospiraceae bacterium]
MEYFYLDGYAFSTREEYNLAVREEKNISSIREKMDLSNKDSVLGIYRRLVSKNMLTTPIGIEFERELRRRLIDEFAVEEVDIPNIRVEHRDKSAVAKNQSQFSLEQLQKENVRLSSSGMKKNIFIVGLIVIVIGMFVIAFFSPNTGYANYEDKIINKYSSWEEELKEREAVVSEKEAKLGITDSESDTD